MGLAKKLLDVPQYSVLRKRGVHFITPTLTDQINLDDCILISVKKYLSLGICVYLGQTRLDADQMYYKVWSHEGSLYKIQHSY